MKVQTQEKPPLLRSDVGNQETTVQSPIAQLDRYLLILRWGIIFSIGITTFFTGFEGREIIPHLPVLVAVTAFNGLLSFFLWKWRVIARGHGGRIILLDIVQATIAVALTGGYRSAFFLLFLLPIIEAAFIYHWRMAIGIIITIDVLHLLSDAAILSQEWQAYAAYIMVVKFILLLTIGAVVTFFDYLILSEYQARKKAAKTASQVKVLNDIFFRLGESHLHLDKTLNIILESTRVLPDFGLALILLPLEGDTQCRIAASTSPHCSPGEQVNVPARWISEPSVLLSVKHQSDPLPDFILRDDLTRLATARMVSITGEYEGLVIVGRRAESPLDQEERTFLQSLAQEAGLALRNARLYIQEQEQIKKLQQFENLRATFFSAIGHELKTPLTVIKMLVPSLHQFSKLPQETQTEISETIENNLMRLEHLISDLLDSARVEAGAIEIYPHSIHLLHHLRISWIIWLL